MRLIRTVSSGAAAAAAAEEMASVSSSSFFSVRTSMRWTPSIVGPPPRVILRFSASPELVWERPWCSPTAWRIAR